MNMKISARRNLRSGRNRTDKSLHRQVPFHSGTELVNRCQMGRIDITGVMILTPYSVSSMKKNVGVLSS